MRKGTAGLAITMVLASQPAAGEATLVLRLGDIGSPTAAPQVLDAETGLPLENSVDSGDWIYELNFGEGQIVRRLKLSIVGHQNAQWVFSDLLMDHPFFRKGWLRIVVEPPSDWSVGSDAVRALWGTSVKDMSSDQLLEFYQRARHVAKYRMNTVGDQWHNTHAYDVRSVFKYLESVITLSKQLYIIPPDDVSKGRDWLSTAVANVPEVVNKAVGLANATKLVQDVDLEEGVRFGLLWNAVIALKTCEKREAYLETYRNWFLKVPSDQRRERIVDVTGVPLASVESALAQCVAERATRAVATGTPEDKEAAKAEVVKQIEVLGDTQSETVSTHWVKKLGSDISTLNGILLGF